MASPSQQRRQADRDAERQKLTFRLDIGEDISSLKTLRFLAQLADDVREIKYALARIEKDAT